MSREVARESGEAGVIFWVSRIVLQCSPAKFKTTEIDYNGTTISIMRKYGHGIVLAEQVCCCLCRGTISMNNRTTATNRNNKSRYTTPLSKTFHKASFTMSPSMTMVLYSSLLFPEHNYLVSSVQFLIYRPLLSTLAFLFFISTTFIQPNLVTASNSYTDAQNECRFPFLSQPLLLGADPTLRRGSC